MVIIKFLKVTEEVIVQCKLQGKYTVLYAKEIECN